MILSPSILSADFADMKPQLELLKENGVKWLHFDIMDGCFVPNITFGPPVLKSIDNKCNLYMDVHMMVHEPIRYIKQARACGADCITVHAEACSNLIETLDGISELGCDVGVAISPETGLDAITTVLDKVDMVLIMTVHPGFGGQTYMDSCTDKIRELYKIKKDNNFGFIIQADGGITLENLQYVLDAGVESIVAGSSVFGGDLDANLKAFKNIGGQL